MHAKRGPRSTCQTGAPSGLKQDRQYNLNISTGSETLRSSLTSSDFFTISLELMREMDLPKVLWAFHEGGRARPSALLLQSPGALEHDLHAASSGDRDHVHDRAISTANALQDLAGKEYIVYATR